MDKNKHLTYIASNNHKMNKLDPSLTVNQTIDNNINFNNNLIPPINNNVIVFFSCKNQS